jgi:hypothetical protein
MASECNSAAHFLIVATILCVYVYPPVVARQRFGYVTATSNTQKTENLRGFKSASEVYRLSDRHWSAKTSNTRSSIIVKDIVFSAVRVVARLIARFDEKVY